MAYIRKNGRKWEVRHGREGKSIRCDTLTEAREIQAKLEKDQPDTRKTRIKGIQAERALHEEQKKLVCRKWG